MAADMQDQLNFISCYSPTADKDRGRRLSKLPLKLGSDWSQAKTKRSTVTIGTGNFRNDWHPPNPVVKVSVLGLNSLCQALQGT